MQAGVAAALEALAVAAFVSPDDLHVAFVHKEGAHGLVALPLAEYQVDVGFATRPEALHSQKARRLLCQPDHLLQVFFVSFYLDGVDLHPQVAQHAHRTPPPSQAVPLHKRPQLRKPRPQHPVWSLVCAIDSATVFSFGGQPFCAVDGDLHNSSTRSSFTARSGTLSLELSPSICPRNGRFSCARPAPRPPAHRGQSSRRGIAGNPNYEPGGPDLAQVVWDLL